MTIRSAAQKTGTKAVVTLVVAALAILIFTPSVHAQVISTVAGNGLTGFNGDGISATGAALNSPKGIAFDAAGNMYIADMTNHRVRRVSLAGVITTVAGTGAAGFNGDGILATSAQLNQPGAIAFDASGNMYIADSQNRRVRKVDTSGIISTIAGTGVEGYSGDGGPATSAMLHRAVDLAIDASGNVYFADSVDHRVRKIATSGIITTFAGVGVAGFSGDNQPATGAQLNFPSGIAFDSTGNLYIADAKNMRVRKVQASDGIIVTIAGNGVGANTDTGSFSGDGGWAVQAGLNTPEGVAVNAAGDVYIADFENYRIRKVDPTTGVITTVAGTGSDGFAGDGGLATQALLNLPWSIAADKRGNVYIGDLQNNRIRRVAFAAIPRAPQPDFNGDLKSDLVWFNASTGQTVGWLMNGTAQSSTTVFLTDPNWKVIGTPDFNGDGKSDVLWYNAATGETGAWLMDGLSVTSGGILLSDPNWKVTATADLNGDGKSDVLWYNAATGQTGGWLMNGLSLTAGGLLLTDANWKVAGTPDLNGDGKADILWYNAATGQTGGWLMNGLGLISGGLLLTDPNWKPAGTPDLNGDGKADILWYNAATGQTGGWLMDGLGLIAGGGLPTDAAWKVTATADLDGDGKSDLLWYNAANGQTGALLMNGLSSSSGSLFRADPNWKIVSTTDFNGDGKADLVWYNAATGQTETWLMNGLLISSNAVLFTDPNWKTVQTGQ